mmetsp:Transcript_32330/g.64490  ORF Transcript_32330/g.64490 Transcript_32330/m.64490 type:complete len:170 (-) Transcript_32330:787-1296(-)
MADFDWWSHTRLETFCTVLRNSGGDTFPAASDTTFWQQAAEKIGFEDAEGSLEELATDVHSEVEGWQKPTLKGIFFGDLNMAESRLMLTVKGVRGVAYISSHQMDTLWRDDGIKYHTLIVTPTSAPSHMLANQLSNLCSFVRDNSPALVLLYGKSNPCKMASCFSLRLC